MLLWGQPAHLLLGDPSTAWGRVLPVRTGPSHAPARVQDQRTAPVTVGVARKVPVRSSLLEGMMGSQGVDTPHCFRAANLLQVS